MISRSSKRIIASIVPLLMLVSAAGPWLGQAYCQDAPKSKPIGQSQAVLTDVRGEDRQAIQAAMLSFVKAFKSRDPKAFAAHWTSEGEYVNESGTTVRGQGPLESEFARFFEKTPDLQAEIQPESMRFVSKDTAIGEGLVTVRRSPVASSTSARYRVYLVRENGRWLLTQLSESPNDKVSIAELEWLIGDWKSTGSAGAEIQTNYSWAPSKKFIHVRFSIKEKELALSGSQVIGVDPATGSIRSWTFEADGGVGEGEWSHDGDHWTLDAVGTLASGAKLTETNILRRINQDTFTWQSIHRLMDDSEIPDLHPVKVSRVKPQ